MFELGNCAATLLILRATELLRPEHGRDSATQLALALHITDNVAATLTSVPAGRAGDRRDPPLVLATGAGCFAAAYVWFAVGPSGVPALAPALVLAGIGIGGAETAEHAAVARWRPPRLRGSAFGVLATIQSLGNLGASVIAGVLWTAVSPSAALRSCSSWCSRCR